MGRVGKPNDGLIRATLDLIAWPILSCCRQVSNANILLMADLARRNQLRFDAILGAEIAGDYKPKPRVYLAAIEAFDLPPGECMMVSSAARAGDIVGAKTVGLRVARLARPDELGPGTAVSIPKESVDVVAQNLIDLTSGTQRYGVQRYPCGSERQVSGPRQGVEQTANAD
jgi:beta-phosphoglucomutase-like phosphatase (HAD superfamily)